MLEIPESNTLARQLSERFTGRAIMKAEAGHSPHGFAFYYGSLKSMRRSFPVHGLTARRPTEEWLK